MSATINWEIQWMKSTPTTATPPEFVVEVGWICTGEQDGFTASVYSTCSFTEPGGESFTPYNQLTEQQVLGWIWANGVDKDATEAAVQQNIDNQINPPIVQPPLPWATPAA